MSSKQDIVRADRKLSKLKSQLAELYGERKSLVKALEEHGVTDVRSARSLTASLKKKKKSLRKKQRQAERQLVEALEKFDV